MAFPDLSFDAVAGKLAGVAGALVSMRFMQGTRTERLTMVVSGAAFSYFATPFLSIKTSMPEGLTGFLLGLFGMAVASKLWEFIQSTPVATLWSVLIDWFKSIPVTALWQNLLDWIPKRKKGGE